MLHPKTLLMISTLQQVQIVNIKKNKDNPCSFILIF